MKCPNCGAEIEEGKTICNYCQKSNNVVHEEPVSVFDTNDDKKKKENAIYIVMFVFPLICCSCFLVFFIRQKPPLVFTIFAIGMVIFALIADFVSLKRIKKKREIEALRREERR